jgi:ribonucleoside-diphosphate reductase beta chain
VLAGYSHLLAAGRRSQWEERDIDLSGDRAGLRAAAPDARARIELLLAGFWVAERGVAEHLAPFVERATDDARACFELQAVDERRHARFFDRVLREVVDVEPEREARRLAGTEIVELFETELPATADRLARGEAALRDAVGVYHLVLEAIVLATGQQALVAELDAVRTLPGTAHGVRRVQADERWHVGLGVNAAGDAGMTGPVDLDGLAARGAAAWGPAVATPQRREHALAAHRRRLRLLMPDRTWKAPHTSCMVTTSEKTFEGRRQT